MFVARNSAKKRGKREKIPTPELQAKATAAAPTPAAVVPSDTRPGATAATADGLCIEDYAAALGLAEVEVWRRLRRGELVGRTRQGRLLIYASPSEDTLSVPEPIPPPVPGTEGVDLSFLPPLPEADGRPGATGSDSAFLTLAGRSSQSPELTLLLDHLSLAKEENREILRMTQDSIRKVSELSGALVEMKNTVIEAKEAEILALREQLEARDLEIRRLAQVNEDLEMLARTIAAQGKRP